MRKETAIEWLYSISGLHSPMPNFFFHTRTPSRLELFIHLNLLSLQNRWKFGERISSYRQKDEN